MSELKEHLFVECDECIREYRGPLSNEMRPYYLKSEADKVIAEKDEVIEELNDKLQNVSELLKETREWLIESQKIHKRCADNAIKKIRHNKYKRCLAMARLCRSCWAANIFIHEGSDRISMHYMKWEKRWLKLAEKFEEAK